MHSADATISFKPLEAVKCGPEMSPDNTSVEDQKKVAFYGSMVEAWIATRMEKDRTLLTLSVGGVGLLATLLTTVGASSRCELLLYGLAGASFIGAAICAISIFEGNARHLREVITKNVSGDDPSLVRRDTILFLLFLAGVVFTAFVGASAGLARLGQSENPTQKGAADMAEKQAIQMPDTTRSLTGAGDLRPGNQSGSGGTPQPGSSETGGGQTGQQGGGKQGS